MIIYNMLKKVYKVVVPRAIRANVAYYRQDEKARKRKRKLMSAINDYFNNNKGEKKEYLNELAYINRTKVISIFPHEYTEKYRDYPLDIHKDKHNGLFFVMHNNKRLYFPRDFSESKIHRTYINLLIEQDPLSPHRYMTEKIYNKNPEILLDVGCAEGMLSLDLIETVKQVILFECGEQWIEALNATFDPWKSKVTIINKYVSDRVLENQTCLDEITADMSGKIIIKMDVEGMEREVLDGANNLLKGKDTIVLCCTYHKKDDAKEFDLLLKQYGFETEFSKGHMLFTWDETLTPPFFRKGLVRGWKTTVD